MSQPPKLLIVIFVSSSQPRPSPWPDMSNLFNALYTKPLEICWQVDSTEFGSLYVVKSVRAVWWLRFFFAESAGLVSKKCVMWDSAAVFSLSTATPRHLLLVANKLSLWVTFEFRYLDSLMAAHSKPLGALQPSEWQKNSDFSTILSCCTDQKPGLWMRK